MTNVKKDREIAIYYNGVEHKPDKEGVYRVNIKCKDLCFVGAFNNEKLRKKSIEVNCHD